MACNDNCITLEQLENILSNYNFTGSSLPVGARVTVGLATFNQYFDSTGLGGDEWEGWAVSNGNNGTVNRLDYMPAYYGGTGATNFTTIDTVGGVSSVTLTTSELPSHAHSFGIASHTHSITDPGHSHTATEDTQLSTASMTTAGGGTFNVNTTGQSITLNKQQLRIETSVAPTNPIDIEVYVPAVNLQAYGGLTSGTENETISGTGSITVPDHFHVVTLGHSHNNTVSTTTTGITIQANTADSGGSVTQSTGSGQPFSILPPHIIEVPVEKIA